MRYFPLEQEQVPLPHQPGQAGGALSARESIHWRPGPVPGTIIVRHTQWHLQVLGRNVLPDQPVVVRPSSSPRSPRPGRAAGGNVLTA
jgi:hypothetical protein